MAHQLYSYAHHTTYAAPSAVSPAPPSQSSLSSLYGAASDALTEPYLPHSTFRYLGRDGSEYLSKYPSSLASSSLSASTMYHHLANTTASHLGYSQLLQHQDKWPPGVEVPTASGVEPLPPGVKRTSEALYYPTVLGAHNSIGQTEAWYTTDYLTKRPKLESTSHLPIYPQRPGEKDCTHYMQTRTCKFGDSCKFDHPIWVPEGGILDWKEAPLAPNESYPERPGEPDCPYFVKTQRCKYGSRCKFNHPKALTTGTSENPDALPDRPSEPPCAFYMKTGKCKFGPTCKFHHPKDIQISSFDQENGSSEGLTSDTNAANKPPITFNPALYHNSKGLPVRPGEVDCPFYLKTGSCKYGHTCRYNHPDRTAFIPPVAGVTYPLVASTAANLNLGVVTPAASLYQTLAQPTIGVVPTVYPQRPGQVECDYYMKTGECKFGERCKFHHPIDRSAAATSKQSSQENVKFTLAGYPRREGAVHCPYYMKTGMCKYGATCRFDHPPPGEVKGKTASSGGGPEADVQ
ncbi:PREDICTED: zinc finger CCCH domain-containing protein 37-like [Tarenaya hassleriana]|uniref:zinc finger CCCH domain-containing protein 37-like n=1 Tax=Tarenaya hassleriana TaxID=28532 RepID=UPI00053C245E|nr:PREDICTED: zinc finger CCCH domain-containing protein 37-like [Tarenaya hassleriana]